MAKPKLFPFLLISSEEQPTTYLNVGKHSIRISFYVHEKGGGGQAQRLTVTERKKLDEYPRRETSRESGLDQDEGTSAYSRETS